MSEVSRGEKKPRLIDELAKQTAETLKTKSVFFTAFRKLTGTEQIRQFFNEHLNDLVGLGHPFNRIEGHRRLAALLNDYDNPAVVAKWTKALHITKDKIKLEKELARLFRRLAVTESATEDQEARKAVQKVIAEAKSSNTNIYFVAVKNLSKPLELAEFILAISSDLKNEFDNAVEIVESNILEALRDKKDSAAVAAWRQAFAVFKK